MARNACVLILCFALAGCGGDEQVVVPPRATVVVDEPAARQAAATFVSTAVARRNVDASWPVTHPDLRGGYTRPEWAKGTIPVQPVPGASAKAADFRLIQVIDEELIFSVQVRGIRFLVTTKRFGEDRRWGVSGFDTAIAP